MARSAGRLRSLFSKRCSNNCAISRRDPFDRACVAGEPLWCAHPRIPCLGVVEHQRARARDDLLVPMVSDRISSPGPFSQTWRSRPSPPELELRAVVLAAHLASFLQTWSLCPLPAERRLADLAPAAAHLLMMLPYPASRCSSRRLEDVAAARQCPLRRFAHWPQLSDRSRRPFVCMVPHEPRQPSCPRRCS